MVDRKAEEVRRSAPEERPAGTPQAEDESHRARRQAEGPAPGAPRSVDDRAVEEANEWKEEAGDAQAERSPPGGHQR
jgi:hypothetical protein